MGMKTINKLKTKKTMRKLIEKMFNICYHDWKNWQVMSDDVNYSIKECRKCEETRVCKLEVPE